MNHDRLSAELQRRAQTSPAPDLLPAVRAAIDIRPQPVISSRLAPLAGLVGVVAALFLLVVALPRLTPGDAPVTVTDTDGDFTLTLSVPRAEFLSGEAIEIEASLAYAGDQESIEVLGESIPGRDDQGRHIRLIGFGLTEAGGPIQGFASGGRGRCVSYELGRDSPVQESFATSIGFSAADPDAPLYRSIATQKPLRLPPGTWQIWAAFGREICDTEVVDLRAEVSITVSTRESEIPADVPAVLVLSPTDFENQLRTGRLAGSTVLVNGRIESDGAAPGWSCGADYGTCGHLGKLAGTETPIPVSASPVFTPEGVGESRSGVPPQLADRVWRWWDLPRVPIEGVLMLSIHDDGTVHFLGSRSTLGGNETPTLADVRLAEPDSLAIEQLVLVEGWMTGLSYMHACDLDGVDVVAGLPQRYCGNEAWITHHPYGSIREGVRVQNGAYFQLVPDAHRPTSESVMVEPVWSRWALAKRLEGWCEPDAPPCWEWQVIGRLTLPTDEPSVTPDPNDTPVATPQVAPTPLVSTMSCPPVQDSLGDAAPTVIDETGLVERCLSATRIDGPPVTNPGGDLSVLQVEWSGSSCDAVATIRLRGSPGAYGLEIMPGSGPCLMLSAPYSIQLELREPIAAEDVLVTRGEPAESAKAMACSGAPPPYSTGAVGIDDHTGWVRGCVVADVKGPEDSRVTSSLDPPAITLTWIAPCASDVHLTRLELWHRPPEAAPFDPMRFKPRFLLIADRLDPTDSSEGCLTAISGRQVRLELEQPIDASDVELFFTHDGRGTDTAVISEGEHQFELSIEADKPEYFASEPIEVSGALLSVGDVTLSGDVGPMFGIEQLDGDIRHYPGPFVSMCPTSVNMEGGVPRSRDFTHPQGADPDGDSDEEFFADGHLRLPVGTYRIFAMSRFSIGETCTQDQLTLEASTVIRVR